MARPDFRLLNHSFRISVRTPTTMKIPQVGRARLSDRSVALVVKRSAKRADLDPAGYAGHSLRAGLAAAAMAGASELAIVAQTGHRSERMVRRYIRDGKLFRDNAAATVL